jgi:hypothetical protein
MKGVHNKQVLAASKGPFLNQKLNNTHFHLSYKKAQAKEDVL